MDEEVKERLANIQYDQREEDKVEMNEAKQDLVRIIKMNYLSIYRMMILKKKKISQRSNLRERRRRTAKQSLATVNPLLTR
jgi:uncharacterized protein YcbK (DUF882 family)